VARTVDPPITLIVDPDDDLACLEQLRRLHARPYGQILCEPAPTATSAELARYLLEGLGKHSQSLTRGQLWRQVDCHLRAEHVHDLALARAHTLTFAALRDLADHARDAGVSVWLLIAAEQPTAAIAQLVEARPHETGELQQLIGRWRRAEAPGEPATVPAGHGSQYPWLTSRTSEKPLTLACLRARLAVPERAVVAHTWQATTEWMRRWLDDAGDCTGGEVARSIYAVASAGDTASEMLVRAQAAIAAVHAVGIRINRRVLEHDVTVAFGESRPLQWTASVQRAAGLIDQTADPQLAAIIALSLVYRHSETTRRVNVSGVAANGTIATSSWAGPRAIPPHLEKALATQRDQQLRAGADPGAPLLPGTTHGRMSAQVISQALAALDAPRSLWHRASDDYDEPDLDGRSILHALNPIALFQPPDR
jgi:hypothetical protein